MSGAQACVAVLMMLVQAMELLQPPAVVEEAASTLLEARVKERQDSLLVLAYIWPIEM